MSGESEKGTYLDALKTVPFWSWVVVCGVGFAVAVIALEQLEAPTAAVFLAGIVFGEVANRVVSHFVDWYLAEKAVKEVPA